MRYFEKISKYKDRDDIILPVRSTIGSAGYDFFAIEDIVIPSLYNSSVSTDDPFYFIKSNEAAKSILVKTGIKVYMEDDEFLMLSIRSSLAYKFNITLTNNSGIVDSSYVDNETNEGEIGFLFTNLSLIPYMIHKGDKIGQGIFMKYLITKDDNVNTVRQGGFGSTGI